MFIARCALIAALIPVWVCLAQDTPPPPSHFHHVHINATNPAESISFYTSKFDCERGKFAGRDAVWAQKSWLLFAKADAPPPSEIVSPIWHIGWGAEDMLATYKKQVESGTKFQTPITDISGLAGRPPGGFYYAYVDGPDHELIELNTANHHHFGHLHLLSADPIAAGEWYNKRLGIPLRGKQTEKRLYEGYPVAPAAFLQADDVIIIIYPVAYARVAFPKQWDSRKDFEPTKGRVIDHVGFSVDNLQETLNRLRGEGVTITTAPAVAGGNIKSAFIEGPDHISIELVEARQRDNEHPEQNRPRQRRRVGSRRGMRPHADEAGARVAIIDLNEELGDALARELGGGARFFRADVADAFAIDSAVRTIAPLHVAVNCAGIGPAQKTLGKDGPGSLELFEKVIRVNLVGAFNVARLAAAAMATNEPDENGERGVIINTASIAAYDGQIGQTAYSASKGGIVGMTLPMARDLARNGIRVMTIAPGIFDTPLLGQISDEVRTALSQSVPFPPRLGQPAEFAKLALHIIENPMLNGEVIRLDGALRMPPK